jgi:hypothetical protein
MAAPPPYDAAIIHEFAARLYRQADSLAYTYAIVGGLIGLLPTYAVSRSGAVALVVAAVLGSIGFSLGRAAGFKLRLQAQTALCQAQIEANTRRG